MSLCLSVSIFSVLLLMLCDVGGCSDDDSDVIVLMTSLVGVIVTVWYWLCCYVCVVEYNSCGGVYGVGGVRQWLEVRTGPPWLTWIVYNLCVGEYALWNLLLMFLLEPDVCVRGVVMDDVVGIYDGTHQSRMELLYSWWLNTVFGGVHGCCWSIFWVGGGGWWVVE